MPKQTFFRLNAEKRGRIERAAMKEFTGYCYQDSNVNRIIQNAAIPPGSFYQYFEDKKDIFFYLLERELIRLERRLGGRRLSALYRDRETWEENGRMMDEGLSRNGRRLFAMLGKAPDWVKRDWAFSVVFPAHRESLYRVGEVPEEVAGSRIFEDNRDFFVALAMAVSVFIGEYAQEPEVLERFDLFSSIFWEGLTVLARREGEAEDPADGSQGEEA